MNLRILVVLLLASLALFAFQSLYQVNKRRSDRRQVRLFAPIQRRKQRRRRTGLPDHFVWAIRARLAGLVKPKEKAKPPRRHH